jgi:tellurite resistance protein
MPPVATTHHFPLIPAAFFGLVLGLAGLGNGWRVAHRVWGLPAQIGEAVMAVAALVWAVLIILFALKWILAREQALEEARHPIQCCFIGLAGVATMLIAGGALPYSQLAAEALYGLGATFTIGFGVWRTGQLWQGGREPSAATPVLYLPTVAGGFVTATVAGALGYPEWGQLAFGASTLSWFAIDSVLLQRFYTVPLPPPLRPTLGVQMAPPAVGAVAYLAVNGDRPDLLAHALIGYGLLQALLMLRLLPWIREQPFAASYWAFSFGITSLATAPLRMVEGGDHGAIAILAPWLFAGANLAVGLIALATLRLMAQGRLLPKPPAAATAAAPR